jgi:SAM-dependent methyltransferase
MKKLSKLFSIRAILYYLCGRFGSPRLRGWAFDQNYPKECWDRFDDTHSPKSAEVVEKYARKGRILDMGCGRGTLAYKLNPDSFESYLGVDVSPAAITMAQKRKSQKINFEIGDLQRYKCREKYDVIVFEESLYYVPFFVGRLLRRYAQCLRPGGLFVVTVAHPDQFRGMIKIIRKNFQIVEDRLTSPSGGRLLLVFH